MRPRLTERARRGHRADGIHAPWRPCSTTCTATCRRSRPCSRTRATAASTSYVLGGDYALFGGWPRETVERLRELSPALWIRGNGERWTAAPARRARQPGRPARDRAARAALGEQLVADLDALPATAPARATLICHGSPGSDVARSHPSRPPTTPSCSPASTRRAADLRPHAPAVPAQRRTDRAAQPRQRRDAVRRRPARRLRADRRRRDVEHRRVAYDHAASAARVRAQGRETVARRIEQARF